MRWGGLRTCGGGPSSTPSPLTLIHFLTVLHPHVLTLPLPHSPIPSPPSNQSQVVSKTSKMLAYINYRMRVTILDGRQIVGRGLHSSTFQLNLSACM